MKEVAFFNKDVYQVPISKTGSIHENLGCVRKRNDSRWEWKRWKSKFHGKIWNGNNQQGVCKTQGEARSKLLEGWM